MPGGSTTPSRLSGRSLKEFPDHHDATADLGKVRGACGRYDEAIALLEKAVAMGCRASDARRSGRPPRQEGPGQEPGPAGLHAPGADGAAVFRVSPRAVVVLLRARSPAPASPRAWLKASSTRVPISTATTPWPGRSTRKAAPRGGLQSDCRGLEAGHQRRPALLPRRDDPPPPRRPVRGRQLARPGPCALNPHFSLCAMRTRPAAPWRRCGRKKLAESRSPVALAVSLRGIDRDFNEPHRGPERQAAAIPDRSALAFRRRQ